MAVLCSIRTSGSCKMPESIEQVVHAILMSPAPVVMPDTSSLLNILEAPVPEEGVSPNVVPAALTLLGRLQAAPPSLHVVLAEVVEEEWLRLHESKQEKTASSIRKADERISFLWGIASTMNSAPAAPYIQFSGLQVAQRLHAIAQQIVSRAKVIGGNADFHSKAGMRIFAGDAPAKPGKKVTEANDCLLIEQYLELCRRLRAAGFTQRCVFITSNTHDFGEPKAPRPPLDQEFADAKMDFVYDLAAAGGLI
jgi:PIN domain-containing protein